MNGGFSFNKTLYENQVFVKLRTPDREDFTQ